MPGIGRRERVDGMGNAAGEDGPMIDFFERVAALRRDGEVFAVATVVGRRAPVSAHLGDHAIVFGDGRMEGFVGGACSREIVRQQAREALQSGQGRLVSIRPDAAAAGDSSAEHVMVRMACASEGAIDVYIEPCLRPRSLVVVGATPVASALARLGRAMEYTVVRVVEEREMADLAADAAAHGVRLEPLAALETVVGRRCGGAAVVVASQGHYDEGALTSVLKARPGYVGLVASRKRGTMVRGMLEASGVPGVETIRVPAGLDLGARTATEIALSILAEVVKAQLVPPVVESVRSEAPAAAPASAVDPVCGMTVEIAGARHTASIEGVDYYFCCAACRTRFISDPPAFRHARS